VPNLSPFWRQIDVAVLDLKEGAGEMYERFHTHDIEVLGGTQIDGIAVITARQTLRERGQMIPLSVACRAAFGATYRWGAAAP
jgi:hypothetical protein